MKKRLKVKCPGCGERLEVDPRSGQVVSLGKGEKPQDLAEAVQRSEERQEAVKDSFSAALEAERHRKDELEDAFRRAAQKAKDSDPENPNEDRWR
ncbi:MAG: hypothetical protein H8E31_08015 [Planctomycetes bacterium]|nr:hypothetical protein [Planctomycetota bacterium]